MNKNSFRPFSLAAIMRRNDQGVALPMVLLVFIVGVALIGAFLVAVVGSANVSNTTRSGIQAQAAAEAGIADAMARIDVSDVCAILGVNVASADPEYEVDVEFRPNGSSSWTNDCPTAQSEMRILSTGVSNGVQTGVERLYEVDFSGGGAMVSGGAAMRTSIGMNLGGGAKITSADFATSPASIFVESGDFTCEQGAGIEGSVYVLTGNAVISGSCPIAGDLLVKGNVKLEGSASIGGSVVSVTGNVIFEGGTKVAGNVYAALDLQMPQGQIGGSAFVKRNASFSGGAPKITGGLTYGGTVTYGYGSQSTWIKGSVQKVVASSIESGPPLPELPSWVDISIADIKEDFSEEAWEGTCVPTSSADFLVAEIPAYSSETVVNAMSCDPLQITASGGELKISTDIVIVAKRIVLNNVKITSANGEPHRIWFVVPTDANCTPGGSPEILLNNTVTFPDNKIRALAYTACEVQFNNAGNSPWPGSVYSKRFSGYAAINFEPIDLPIKGALNPPLAGGGTTTGPGRATINDLSKPILQRNVT